MISSVVRIVTLLDWKRTNVTLNLVDNVLKFIDSVLELLSQAVQSLEQSDLGRSAALFTTSPFRSHLWSVSLEQLSTAAPQMNSGNGGEYKVDVLCRSW